MSLQNKVVVITGASAGIGLVTAKLLNKQGARLALVSRSKEKLDRLSRELPHSLAVPTDMTNFLEIKKMIKKVQDYFGRIDILINNAGQGYDAPVEKINIDTFHYIFDLNLVSPLIAMQQVIPIMREQGGGKIINISSGSALMLLPNMSAYSSLKRALSDISLIARQELKKDNITVTVVYPYITSTDFEKNTIKDSVPNIEEESDSGMFKVDTAEYIAEKILIAIESGEAEIFAHDWMKKMTR